jgi:hypothetical protein
MKFVTRTLAAAGLIVVLLAYGGVLGMGTFRLYHGEALAACESVQAKK